MRIHLVPAVFALLMQSAWAADCDRGISVTLEGEVVTRAEYGPPNWGADPAHDSTWIMAVLILSPASIKATAEFAFDCEIDVTNRREVQLWSVDESAPWTKYAHRTIRASGVLSVYHGAPAELLPLQLKVNNVVQL